MCFIDLRLSAIHYPPYSILEPVLDGSDVRIAIEYGRIHNCSLKLIQPSDGKRWGVIYNNGTATGNLNYLQIISLFIVH